jgi:hypothetical protein
MPLDRLKDGCRGLVLRAVPSGAALPLA